MCFFSRFSRVSLVFWSANSRTANNEARLYVSKEWIRIATQNMGMKKNESKSLGIYMLLLLRLKRDRVFLIDHWFGKNKSFSHSVIWPLFSQMLISWPSSGFYSSQEIQEQLTNVFQDHKNSSVPLRNRMLHMRCDIFATI